ncbi:MAG: MgtC/SapB family protein [Candidatus Nanoarchaeia archaeon]|jgi:uncharacterized membrane protein (DUF4010 family)
MDFLAFLLKTLLSLALGGLIGIDRQKSKNGYPAGIRTLAFISLLGFLSCFISNEINNSYFLIASFLLIFILIIVGYGVSFNSEKFFGFTSTIIIFLTFLIGVISYYEQYYYFAVSLSIVITLILTQKTFIHTLVSKIQDNELFDALKFGIIAFIILPVLPNKTIDPLGVINPFNLWLLVVLILLISYAGYILSKFLGKSKGIYISGLLGGLISSTAVTSSLSILSKKNEAVSNSCIVGITLASSVMFLMVFFEALLTNPSFAYGMIIPFSLCFLIGLLISWILIKSPKTTNLNNAELVSESPFNFFPAVKFMALIVVILFISKLLLMVFGDKGIYLVSFFSSLANTDAVTISIATLAKESLAYSVAYLSMAIAVLTNNLMKLFLIKQMGSKRLFADVFKNYLAMNAPILVWIIFLLI